MHKVTTAKPETQAEYMGANKSVERDIGADEQKRVEDLAVTDEKAARGGNMVLKKGDLSQR